MSLCALSNRLRAALRIATTVAVPVYLAFAATRDLHAQMPAGSLKGTVLTDPGEHPIRDAEVSLSDVKLSVRSDSAGNFQLTGVPAGKHDLVVRQLGYESFTGTMTFASAQNVEADFTLKSLSTKLAKVTVRDTAGARYGRRLAEFEDRRKFGIGRFLTADVFAKAEGRNMSAVLVERIPGLKTVGKSTEQVLSSTRYGTCYVQIVLNGMTIYNGNQAGTKFDINSLYAANVIGFEYYSTAETPLQYNSTTGGGGGATCGTAIIWTK